MASLAQQNWDRNLAEAIKFGKVKDAEEYAQVAGPRPSDDVSVPSTSPSDDPDKARLKAWSDGDKARGGKGLSDAEIDSKTVKAPGAPVDAPSPAASAPKSDPEEGQRKETQQGWAVKRNGKWELEAAPATPTQASAPAAKPKEAAPQRIADTPKKAYGIMDDDARAKALENLEKMEYSLPKEERAAFAARRTEIDGLVKDAEARFKDREDSAQWREVAEMLGHAFTQLGAGYYGLKTGVDLSGIPFKKNDWQKEMDRIYDHYDRTVNRNLKMKESVSQDEQAASKEAYQTGKDKASTISELLKTDTSARTARGRDLSDNRQKEATLEYDRKRDEERSKDRDAALVAKSEENDKKITADKEKKLQSLVASALSKNGTKEQAEQALRESGVSDKEIEDAKHWYRSDKSTLRELLSKKSKKPIQEE